MMVVQELGHTFSGSNGSVLALSDLTFEAGPGDFIAIVGPSGCGKTTLLRLLGGLLVPTCGRVMHSGLPASEVQSKGYFGYVFQNPALLPWLDVLDNIRLPERIRGKASRPAQELVAQVGLEGFEHHLPATLSGGMKQRAALARAISFEPRVLLLDEPFGALDDLTREVLDNLLQRIWSETGALCVMVTHSLSEAVYLANRVLVLTPRPGRPQCWFDVPFLRPRIAELRQEPSFQCLVCKLREALKCGM